MFLLTVAHHGNNICNMLICVKYKNNKTDTHAPVTQLGNYSFLFLKKKYQTHNYCELTSLSLPPPLQRSCTKGNS